MVASSIDISTTPDLAKLVDRATASQEIITLTAQGEKKPFCLA
jgi:hypothetical protein